VQASTQRGAAPSGAARIVWQVLAESLPAAAQAPSTVLDCGGGTGSFAVPLAQAGAAVTVVDSSVDALAILQRRAAEAGVADAVTAIQGDAEALADAIGPAVFDLVLAHGILEAVDDPQLAFTGIAAAVALGGRLSVLVRNPAAGVLARALSGDVSAALADFRRIGAADARPGPDAVAGLCAAAGLSVESVHGVGVFSDLVPGAALETPGAQEALDELESAASTQSPLSLIASRVHILARRAAQ
jgi:SAM-dependent methyltransferase